MREKYKKHPQNQYFLVRGACFYHEKVRTLDYKGVRTGILCGFEFYRTAIIRNMFWGYGHTNVMLHRVKESNAEILMGVKQK